jgi:hypothetical protein
LARSIGAYNRKTPDLLINATVRYCTENKGTPVRDEDVARLSPFIHERHINLLGRYSFAVPEAVTRGELRPLRNPNDADA